MNDKERFEDKYFKHSNGCWEWIGALTSFDYGAFWLGNETVRAHRFSYELYVGSIPDDLCILHKCNNRRCVNPGHLYLGTYLDNVNDSVKAGTHCTNHEINFGDHRTNTKLSRSDIVCIRKMLRDKIKRWLIAWIYQIGYPNISLIATGKTWVEVKI